MKIEVLKKATLDHSSREAVADALSKDTIATLNNLGISVNSETAKAIQSRAQSLKTNKVVDATAAAFVHLDF